MNILFINGSPEADGNTVRLAHVLLNGRDHETVNLDDYKIYDYGTHFDDDQFEEVLAKLKKADIIIVGSPVYWHDLSGMLRCFLDRCYGPVPEGSLAGKRLFFLFQGAAPTSAMLERGNFTMDRFARLYGMEYEGMATNTAEAQALACRL